jgi:predicted Holliday junction resolvase-like endonuclease
VNRSSKTVIAQLQGDRRFMGTCPLCNNDFFLADAVLFGIDDAPPEEALAAIQAARAAIKERKEEVIEARERMSDRAAKISEAVNIGKIVEKIVPSFSSFEHSPGDCRALFEPIDYLIFSGLTKTGKVDSLLFVDVKSGNARLSYDQRAIKGAIEAGAVDFATIDHVRRDE